MSEAISFRPRVISIFSIFDSISTSLLISITAVLDNASMMEASCVWKEKTVDMFICCSAWHTRCARTSCWRSLNVAWKRSYNVKHRKSCVCVPTRYAWLSLQNASGWDGLSPSAGWEEEVRPQMKLEYWSVTFSCWPQTLSCVVWNSR